MVRFAPLAPRARGKGAVHRISWRTPIAKTVACANASFEEDVHGAGDADDESRGPADRPLPLHAAVESDGPEIRAKRVDGAVAADRGRFGRPRASGREPPQDRPVRRQCGELE